MKMLPTLLIAATLTIHGLAWAADRTKAGDADLSVRSARVETLRARLGANPSATASATLIEAENLLRLFQRAPSDQKDAVRSQLDAALTRLDLEIDAAGRNRL